MQHVQLCTLVVFPTKMASNDTQMKITTLKSKYSQLTVIIDVEHSKIKRDTPTVIRQAILENILNLKREQIDIRFEIQQLQAKK